MIKTIPIWLFLGATLGAADGQSEVKSSVFPFFEPVRPPRAIQVVARRGAMRRIPANKAPSLALAIADAVEWVQVDVRLATDGRHVVFDDDPARNKNDVKGLTRELALAEVLVQARGRVNLCLDCVGINPALLAKEVIAAGMERQVVIAGTPETLSSIRATSPSDLALLAKWRPRSGIDPWFGETRPATVEIEVVDVTAEACREFRRRGVKVQVNTKGGDDRPAVWDRMAAAGVDWLQTDLAEELLAWQALKSIQSKPVKIAHHRGAGRYAPENTLPALEKAIRLGADFVEFDLQTTRDDGCVLLHDRTLARTTNGIGLVRDWDLLKIQGLDAGSWFGVRFAGTKVPNLDEFLEAAGRRVELYVDAKDIAPEALAAALKRHGLTERAVVYQRVEYLERLRSIDPAIRRMPPLRDPARLDFTAERVRPYAVDAGWSILSRELIDRCHARGIQVFSDALGSHETIENYQTAIRNGIDVIQTDHPVRVLRAIQLYNPHQKSL